MVVTANVKNQNDMNIQGHDRQKDHQGDSRLNVNTEMKKFDRISKDGDTLEIGKTVISDALLKSYSESKLRQLYSEKEISKQQYDKAVESKENFDL